MNAEEKVERKEYPITTTKVNVGLVYEALQEYKDSGKTEEGFAWVLDFFGQIVNLEPRCGAARDAIEYARKNREKHRRAARKLRDEACAYRELRSRGKLL